MGQVHVLDSHFLHSHQKGGHPGYCSKAMSAVLFSEKIKCGGIMDIETVMGE